MKADLKIIKRDNAEKKLDDMTMLEITGKVQNRSHLTPPFFEDATDRPVEPTPFKLRLKELFKGNN